MIIFIDIYIILVCVVSGIFFEISLFTGGEGGGLMSNV